MLTVYDSYKGAYTRAGPSVLAARVVDHANGTYTLSTQLLDAGDYQVLPAVHEASVH